MANIPRHFAHLSHYTANDRCEVRNINSTLLEYLQLSLIADVSNVQILIIASTKIYTVSNYPHPTVEGLSDSSETWRVQTATASGAERR